jgi:hypothetical protein
VCNGQVLDDHLNGWWHLLYFHGYSFVKELLPAIGYKSIESNFVADKILKNNRILCILERALDGPAER